MTVQARVTRVTDESLMSHCPEGMPTNGSSLFSDSSDSFSLLTHEKEIDVTLIGSSHDHDLSYVIEGKEVTRVTNGGVNPCAECISARDSLVTHGDSSDSSESKSHVPQEEVEF